MVFRLERVLDRVPSARRLCGTVAGGLAMDTDGDRCFQGRWVKRMCRGLSGGIVRAPLTCESPGQGPCGCCDLRGWLPGRGAALLGGGVSRGGA